MPKDQYDFQYCQKLILFSGDMESVLLAKRNGEADYDGTFTFVGGKMEHEDISIQAGLKREKDEEVGSQMKLNVYMDATNNVLFLKKDGSRMIIPHYIARHVSGEPRLNHEEYSEFQWVKTKDLDSFGPKVPNILQLVAWARQINAGLTDADFVEI